MNENLYEVILIVAGLVAGWMISSTSSQATKNTLIKSHQDTVKAHDKRAKAKIALAEAKKKQAEKAKNKIKSNIKKMNLSELAKAVRDTFGKDQD